MTGLKKLLNIGLGEIAESSGISINRLNALNSVTLEKNNYELYTNNNTKIYLKFQNNLNDETINANNGGSLIGGASFNNTGYYPTDSYNLPLDGSDDKISIPSSSSLESFTNAVTIEVVIRFASFHTDNLIIMKGDVGGGAPFTRMSFYLQYHHSAGTGSNINIYLYSNDNRFGYSMSLPSELKVDTNYVISFSKDLSYGGADLAHTNFVVNGLTYSIAYDGGYNGNTMTTLQSNNKPLTLGASFDDSGINYYYISPVTFIRCALHAEYRALVELIKNNKNNFGLFSYSFASNANLKQYYHFQGSGSSEADQSGNSNTGSLNGGYTREITGFFPNQTKSLTLNGSNAYVLTNNSSSLQITNDITFHYAFKIANNTSTMWLSGKEGSGNSTWQTAYRGNLSPKRFSFILLDTTYASNGHFIEVSANASLTVGTKYILQISWNNTTKTINFVLADFDAKTISVLTPILNGDNSFGTGFSSYASFTAITVTSANLALGYSIENSGGYFSGTFGLTAIYAEYWTPSQFNIMLRDNFGF